MAELDDKLEEVTRIRRASDPQTLRMPTMTKLHSAPAAPLVKVGSSTSGNPAPRPPTPLQSSGRRNTAPGLIPTSASLDVPPLMTDDVAEASSPSSSSTSSAASPSIDYMDTIPYALDTQLVSAKAASYSLNPIMTASDSKSSRELDCRQTRSSLEVVKA
ncbi:hypothetical protein OIO90_001963 [Microbotryomycetes sp. JL221]|nr:hypothetical protein OIO90_001963 [Microbotryomycetes sp. JL221]